MANLKDLTVTVNANLTVTDETVERCLRLIEIWQEDNPNKTIQGEWIEGSRVRYGIIPFPKGTNHE